jgi:peptidoglycan/xylan/chitin deacetylase (PgdA/CDA1 family)
LLEELAERHFWDGVDSGVPATLAAPLPADTSPILVDLASGMSQSRAVRVVNFHATPRYSEAQFREQIATVSRVHAFACHTRTHNAVEADTPTAVLEDEIVVAKAEMEAELGTPIEIYCSLEGAATGVNPQADAMLRQAGFRYLFSNFKIQTLS